MATTPYPRGPAEVVETIERTSWVRDGFEEGYAALRSQPGVIRESIGGFVGVERSPERVLLRAVARTRDGRKLAVEIVLHHPA